MRADYWDRVSSVFESAADLPRLEQARFLDSACADDPDLRVEIEALLASDRKTGAGISAAVEKEASLVFDSPRLGDRLGSYRVQGVIGRGGMGSVYLATRDDDQFQRQVAIKIVKRGMDTAEVLARFRYERQILANLEHPYIASLYDGGTTEDGRPFFAMEYVQGQPVDTFCRDQALDRKARCRLFVRICEAVSHAHRNLVIHRDLKPGNILITRDQTPKLLDFGLAKVLARDADQYATLAMTRQFTPAYASPEQVLGLPVTTATDVYSLGAILYELLTGKRAHQFSENSELEMRRVVCELPIRPPRAIAQDLDPDLDNIVLMAMRKEPDRRYQSVDQFAQDIRSYLESRPVIARGNSLWYRSAKFARRKRYALASGAAVLASLIFGIVIAFVQARDARAARHGAKDLLAQVGTVSNRLLSDAYSLMERLPGAMPARREFIDSMLNLLAKLSLEAENDVELRLPLAKAYLRLGDLQGDPDSSNIGDMAGASKSYQAAAALLGSGPPPDGGDRLLVWVDVQYKTGKMAVENGDRTRAREIFLQAIQVLEGSHEIMAEKEASRLRAELYLALARATFDLALALRYADESRAACEAAVSLSPGDPVLQLLLSSVHTHIGYVHSLMSEPEPAARAYELCIRIRERLYREHPNDQLFRRYLKLAYEHYASLQGGPGRMSLGHPEIARRYYEKARPLEQADLTDPQNSSAKFDYALFLISAARVEPAAGEMAESLAKLRQAQSTFESLAAGEPGIERYARSLASTHEYIGDRLRAMGRYDEAIVEYHKALKIMNQLFAAETGHSTLLRDILATHRDCALALMAANEREKALDQAQEALRRAEAAEPSTRPAYVAEANLTLAKIHEKFGECVQSRAAAERSIQAVRPLARPPKRDPATQILEEAQAVVAACSGWK